VKEWFYPAAKELSKNQNFGLISCGQYDLKVVIKEENKISTR
jgi:hypothetical protein